MLRQFIESRLSFYQHSLSLLSSSSLNFKIVHSVSTQCTSSNANSNSSLSVSDVHQRSTRSTPLYILDASFNPPTVAHMRMILYSDLFAENSFKAPYQSRLLLLLAVNNADKPSQPASLEHRLSMMEMFCNDLLLAIPDIEKVNLKIDIGIISNPYFVDKMNTIENSGLYPLDMEHIYHIGFDTLVRIMNPRYYPPNYTLEKLGPFLEKHRFLVFYRLGGEYGSKSEQENFLVNIANGKLDAVAGQREWVREGRIKFCTVSNFDSDDGIIISSTKVRDIIKNRDETHIKNTLGKLLTPHVREWIEHSYLYI